jgi:hypothetical protein
LTLFAILRRQGYAVEARAMVEEELSRIELHGNVGMLEVALRLAVVEARLEMGETHRALEALAAAKAALLAIAAYIGDSELQESFLRRVPAHRRTLELAERYGI